MQFLRSRPVLFLAGVFNAFQISIASFCDLHPGPIISTQALEGEAYTGIPVRPRPLLPKLEFPPRSSTVHADGGNTNTVDYPGPLGRNWNITTLDLAGLGIFYWDAADTMYGIYIGACNGSDADLIQAIGVVNPKTVAIEAAWSLPYTPTTALNTAYTQVLMDTKEIVVSSAGGQIYILQKSEDATTGSPAIHLRRTIDLSTSGVLKGIRLLNTVMDAAGNVWFTTGALGGVGGPAGDVSSAPNSSIVGYVEHNGNVHSLEIPNQSIGQGVALNNRTIFVVTEPSGSDVHANATGFLMALRAGPGNSVNVAWNATYDAGSNQRPGALARGSGTTPALLGNDFVAITDNSDAQMNLLIYGQNASGHEDVEPICKIPVFQPNASWTDNNPMVHFDGEDYGVVLENMWNAPAYADTHSNDTNGSWNNMTGQAPGIQKIVVPTDGSGCYIAWTNPGRTTTVPILSTRTGLLYAYEQEAELAEEGEYVWYATAIDYRSGETVWKVRAGAGGVFNNNLRTTLLSPEGTLYQMVTGGAVAVRDS
jgi:hypothetical protein